MASPESSAGRLPLAALVLLQGLVFCVPNGLVQGAARGVPLRALLLVQALNLATLVVLMLLFRTPRASRWALLPLAVLALAATDFLHHFGGMPYAGAYQALAHTTGREALEYLWLKRQSLAVIAAAAAAYGVAFGALAGRCGPGAFARVRKPALCACLCVIAVVANWDTFPIDTNRTRPDGNALALKNSFPIGFFLSAGRAYQTSRDMHTRNRDFRFHAVRSAPVPERETYVLVIGESASADFWSLGGYPDDTTPRMRKYQASGELVYFPRTAAQASSTWLAVPMIITHGTPSTFSDVFSQKSLLSAFREAGFTTYWISNQNAAAHMDEADFPILLHPSSGIMYTNYDEDLWPYLDSVIASTQQKTLIVLHLMGSHTVYERRVPASFRTEGLSGPPLTRQYARTICYTDYVLDGIIQRLGRVPGRSFLWYVSDHGQILLSSEVGHGSLEASVHELHVPMLAWANPAFRAAAGPRFRLLGQRAGAVLSQGVTFPTFLGLGGVTYPGLDESRDLSSPAFIPGRKPEVLNGEARAGQIDHFLEALVAGKTP